MNQCRYKSAWPLKSMTTAASLPPQPFRTPPCGRTKYLVPCLSRPPPVIYNDLPTSRIPLSYHYPCQITNRVTEPCSFSPAFVTQVHRKDLRTFQITARKSVFRSDLRDTDNASVPRGRSAAFPNKGELCCRDAKRHFRQHCRQPTTTRGRC